MAVTEVRVGRDRVRLDVEGLCGARLAPTGSVVLPEHVEVYRIGVGWGEPVPCSEADRARWEGALRTFLDRLSRALEEVYRAHGGRSAVIDLAEGSRAWHGIGRPRRWPGRQRRATERSVHAQQVFALELHRVTELYRPVRAELEQRVAEALVARKAAEEARRREERRRRAVLDGVAAREVWLYRPAGRGEPVRIHRSDIHRSDLPAAEPPGAPEGPQDSASPSRGPLTARELATALRELVRAPDGSGDFRWDERARAATEEECRAQDVAVTFHDWWREVTGNHWRAGPEGPQPVVASPGTRGSSRSHGIGGTGVSGSGGYSGGHGLSGFGGFGGY
ncbi:hypothetical protein [Kitasatospora sp. NPDC002965]|uniref:hypothetical protein n=1 Tax=Kitasatospora sp. NPDC002965 TaxID=3154775 RepID=UPI0033BA81E2